MRSLLSLQVLEFTRLQGCELHITGLKATMIKGTLTFLNSLHLYIFLYHDIVLYYLWATVQDSSKVLINSVLHITCSISATLHLWSFVSVSRWQFPLFSTVWAEQWVSHQGPYYEAFEIITEIWLQVLLSIIMKSMLKYGVRPTLVKVMRAIWDQLCGPWEKLFLGHRGILATILSIISSSLIL